MKISLSWLKRYIDIDLSVDELVDALPMLGLEVDEVETIGLPQFDNIVVGEILTREPHPDADRLGVCTVDVGDGGAVRQIVCGATNYSIGDRVPVALPGARLPGDFKIKRSKLRGVVSEGMMCSARELGLGDDHHGLLILEQRPEIGTPINTVFPDSDTVLTLEVTANRGDCLSYLGVAREIAARFSGTVRAVEPKADLEFEPEPGKDFPLEAVVIDSPDCPLYSACAIRNVKVGPSPDWLQRDLRAMGLRPINNIVDITNWVLFETGQPLHAFDLAKIQGKRLVVRQAVEGEQITTLDGKRRSLSASTMVIADAAQPLVVAGVMGCEDAGVTESTTDIILEAAWFRPHSVRATARRLGLHSDSSNRFARDVDPAGVLPAARRAVDLILEFASGSLVEPGVCVGRPPRGDARIEVTANFIRSRCGFPVENHEMVEVFLRLGFGVKSRQSEVIPQPIDQGEPDPLACGTVFDVTVPSRRSEVTRPIDLVEEFVRMYGTDRIPEAGVTMRGLLREDDAMAIFQRDAIALLVASRLVECCHYSLRKADELEAIMGAKRAAQLALDNPLTADLSHLRPSLMPGLLDAWRLNRNQGNTVYGFFETGRIFRPNEAEVFELFSVAGLIPLSDAGEWLERPQPDFFLVKGLVERLAGLAGIDVAKLNYSLVDDDALWEPTHAAHAACWVKNGYMLKLGMVNLQTLKRWDIDAGCAVGFELMALPALFEKAVQSPRYTPFSSYPPSTKDLALVVPAAAAAEDVRRQLATACEEAAKKDDIAVEAVRLFDIYTGKGIDEGKKSLAFSLVFRAADRTLAEEQIAPLFQAIQKQIESETDYRVRR